MTITDHFRHSVYDYSIEQIVFADGTVLTSQDIRDKSVSDQKSSGTVKGSADVENYVHSLGDGSYRITDLSHGSNTDTLTFTGVNVGDVTFGVNAGYDLVVTLTNGETVTITDHFDGTQYSNDASNNIEDMERIVFADGTVLNQADILAKMLEDTVLTQVSAGDDVVKGTHFTDVINAGTGNDTLDGGKGADQYIYRLGDGNDVIRDFSYGNENDTLAFADVNVDDVIFGVNAGYDLVVTLTNGETITITDHFDGTFYSGVSSSRYDMERIVFADGTELDQSDILTKTIVDNVQAQVSDGDDVIAGTHFAEVIDAGAGDDSVSAGDRNDRITGGLGHDTLDGGEGTDTYFYSLGDGNDIIKDFSYSSSEHDRLVLSDIRADEVSFAQNAGQDLVITLSNGETITITDHFRNSQSDMEEFVFADGAVVSNLRFGDAGHNSLAGSADFDYLAGQGGNDVLSGLDGDDSLFGGDGFDRLYGGAGHDTLYGGNARDFLFGGAGNDELHLGAPGWHAQIASGGAGNDTYVINRGEGFAGVGYEHATGGYDRIIFEDINFDELSIRQHPNAAFTGSVIFAGAGVNIHVNGGNPADGRQHHIEEFVFADMTLTAEELMMLF